MQQSYQLPEMPIFRAARLGDLAALQQLLDAGTNINDRTDIATDDDDSIKRHHPKA